LKQLQFSLDYLSFLKKAVFKNMLDNFSNIWKPMNRL